MRRFLLTFSAVLALVVLAKPAEAQLKFGAQGAIMTGLEEVTGGGFDLNGTLGIGGRVMLDPPLLPVALVGSATYYFPDGDLTYWTATAAAQLRLPLPMIKPYVTGGWQLRRSAAGGVSSNENGPMIGAGLQLDLGLSLFLEGTFEFNEEITTNPDFDNNPLVITGGILFGG